MPANDVAATLGLRGRVALVTGAGGGIGAAVVALLSELGASVVATDANSDALDRLPKSTVGSAAIVADIGAKGACDDLVARVIERHGRIDILVNNAALLIRKEIDEYEDADWDRTFDVNLRSQFLLCRATSRSMRAHNWAHRQHRRQQRLQWRPLPIAAVRDRQGREH